MTDTECELLLKGLQILMRRLQRKETVDIAKQLARTLQEHLESQEIVTL